MNPSEAEQLRELVATTLAGAATADEQQQLHDLVIASEENCQFYLEAISDELSLSALLGHDDSETFAIDPSLSTEDEPVVPESRLRRIGEGVYYFITHPTALSLLVAGLFVTTFVLSMAMITLSPIVSQPAPRLPSRADYVARIYDLQDAEWNLAADESNPQLNDDLMLGQTLELQKGFARLRYDTGTMVLLEAPATYVVTGENAGDLRLGKLVARIGDEATGFVLSTPQAKIIDLGTEFGAQVVPGKQLDVEVFEGSVRLEASGRQLIVRAGKSAVAAAQSIKIVTGQTGFARRMPSEAPGPYAIHTLAAKPLAYYRFSTLQSESGDLFEPNRVGVGHRSPLPGLNPNAGFAGFEQGNRWCNFAGGLRDVLTNLKPGWSSKSGTISYWVRMNDDGHTTQTHLFGSDDGSGGFNATQGCIASFARRNGSFGIRIENMQIETKPGAIADVTKWNHFAFTWKRGEEPDSSEISLYLNGELVKTSENLDWDEFTITDTLFGKEASGNGRIFDGSLDELTLFAEPLSAVEISRQAGFATQPNADKQLNTDN